MAAAPRPLELLLLLDAQLPQGLDADVAPPPPPVVAEGHLALNHRKDGVVAALHGRRRGQWQQQREQEYQAVFLCAAR